MTNNMQTTPETSFQFEITIDEKGENYIAGIAKFIGEETEAVIPDEFDISPMREILQNLRLEKLSKIDTLPVKRIDDGAFCGCKGLTRLTISASVTEIGDGAFHDCPNLTIHAPAGSTAEEYAKKNGIPFEVQP